MDSYTLDHQGCPFVYLIDNSKIIQVFVLFCWLLFLILFHAAYFHVYCLRVHLCACACLWIQIPCKFTSSNFGELDSRLHSLDKNCSSSCNHLGILTVWDFHNQIFLWKNFISYRQCDSVAKPHKDELTVMKSQGNVRVFQFSYHSVLFHPEHWVHFLFPLSLGLPWWLRGWSVCLQWGRPGFEPWVGKFPWRRKWQPTPVLLPGESQGQRSLVGYSSWGRKESDTTEWLHLVWSYGPLGIPGVEIWYQGPTLEELYAPAPAPSCSLYNGSSESLFIWRGLLGRLIFNFMFPPDVCSVVHLQLLQRRKWYIAHLHVFIHVHLHLENGYISFFKSSS